MINIKTLKSQLRLREVFSDDDYIVELEAAAVAMIENETGRYYGKVRERTELQTGTGAQLMRLAGPVVADAYGPIVTERRYPGDTGSTIESSATNGFVVRENGLYRRSGYVWRYGYEYEVVYQQGYSEGGEPADIRLAVMQLVTLWYQKRLPVAELELTPIPMSARAIIDANRRMVI